MQFITPPDHINLRAKRLCENIGEIMDVSLAYVGPEGGGPLQPHTHDYDHLFIVVEGQAKAVFEDGEAIIDREEALLVEGSRPHAVWNNGASVAVMINITVKQGEKHG
jgi:mannose-6-phosphate isomerase-like protein (cupin superfamily)